MRCTAELLTKEAPYKGQPSVLTSPNPLSTLHRRFACARLSQPYLPGSSSRRFRSAQRTIHTTLFAYKVIAWRRKDRLFLHVTGENRTAAKHQTLPVSAKIFMKLCFITSVRLDIAHAFMTSTQSAELNLGQKVIAPTDDYKYNEPLASTDSPPLS